jgi:hypothetical protein
VLYLAFELGWNSWKLAFTIGAGQKPRLRSLPARSLVGLDLEVRKAKKRFGLPPDAPVISCYEAGRDGFWLHRYLGHEGIPNLVVDSASIEVNRRKRRAQSDRLDAVKPLSMLIRWHDGEQRVWSVVRVPTVDDEDRRQLHRDLIRLIAERTEHDNRIKGLVPGDRRGAGGCGGVRGQGGPGAEEGVVSRRSGRAPRRVETRSGRSREGITSGQGWRGRPKRGRASREGAVGQMGSPLRPGFEASGDVCGNW